MERELISKEVVAQALELRDYGALRAFFQEGEIADVAEILAQMDLAPSVALVRLVPRRRRSSR